MAESYVLRGLNPCPGRKAENHLGLTPHPLDVALAPVALTLHGAGFVRCDGLMGLVAVA